MLQALYASKVIGSYTRWNTILKNVDQSLQQYRSILYSSCLERINHEFWVTEDVKLFTALLADSWVQLEKYITLIEMSMLIV